MLGRLGVIQIMKAGGLKASNETFWKIFQEKPYLRLACWELWLERGAIEGTHFPEILGLLIKYLHDVEGKRSGTVEMQSQRLLRMVWDIFHQKIHWEERLALLGKMKSSTALAEEEMKSTFAFAEEELKGVSDFTGEEMKSASEQRQIYFDLYKGEKEYVERRFTAEQRKAIAIYKRLEAGDIPLNVEEFQKEAMFVARHHPSEDARMALPILLRNYGIADADFLSVRIHSA